MTQLHVLGAEHDLHEMPGRSDCTDSICSTNLFLQHCERDVQHHKLYRCNIIACSFATSLDSRYASVQLLRTARESSTSEQLRLVRYCYAQEGQDTPLAPAVPCFGLRAVITTPSGQTDRTIWSLTAFVSWFHSRGCRPSKETYCDITESRQDEYSLLAALQAA